MTKKKSKVGNFFGWVFGLLFLISSISLISSAYYFGAMTYILVGLVCIPPTWNWFLKKIKKDISGWGRVGIIVGLVVVGMFISQSYGGSVQTETDEIGTPVLAEDTGDIEVDSLVEPIDEFLEKMDLVGEMIQNQESDCAEAISTCESIDVTCASNDVTDTCEQVVKLCESNDGVQATLSEPETEGLSDAEIENGILAMDYALDSMDDREIYLPAYLSTVSDYLSECPEPYKVGDTIIAGNFAWTINGMRTAGSIGDSPYLMIDADGEFLILEVEIENIGNSAEYLSSSYIKLVDDQGREFVSDLTAQFYLGSSITFDTINPGIVKDGEIAFDVPTDLTVVDVQISDSLIGSSYYNINLFSEHIN